MIAPIFDTAPDFDQPIAVLKHCHDRIRKQLATLEKLAEHLAHNSVDDEASKAAAAVLKYFNQAAPHHHQDEEQDLLPMLATTATGADAVLLSELAPQILSEHVRMDAAWQLLEPQLAAIASGTAMTGGHLDAVAVRDFAESYATHMEKEEGSIAPMAKRIFSAAQMTILGNAMRSRRGIATS